MPHQLLLAPFQAKTCQHLLPLNRAGRQATQRRGKAQVFINGHGFLQRVQVSQVTEVPSVGFSLLLNWRGIPQNAAVVNRGQATYHAQEAGLADTIGSRDIKPLARVQVAVDVGEQLPSTLGTAKLGKRQ